MSHTARAALAQLAFVAACASASLAVSAQTAGAGGAIPPMEGQGDVKYVCGGIGLSQSTAMREAMSKHPLSLLFARPDGNYLADVQVRIERDGKDVLSTLAAGPVCLIDLPNGKYTVHASKGGTQKSRSVTVSGAPVTADFRFE